jgi:bifunctional DNA-binding transcriptional regulator/antitoxin component of YhaV-PrlF toxin-antitoxin module
LPRLFDDDDEVDDGGRWSFAIVTIERAGRVTLPAVVRTAIEGARLRLSSRGEVALLRSGGGGRPAAVDGRGRVVVPCWLRDAADPEGRLLVGIGTGHDREPIVLFAPLRLLWGFADAMVGDR